LNFEESQVRDSGFGKEETRNCYFHHQQTPSCFGTEFQEVSEYHAYINMPARGKTRPLARGQHS
jgi:hypothetical protein